MINLLGWIGNCFFIIGAYTFTRKSIFGFYFNITANLLYIWQALFRNNSPLFWLSLILLGINCVGIKKWNQKSYIILGGNNV